MLENNKKEVKKAILIIFILFILICLFALLIYSPVGFLFNKKNLELKFVTDNILEINNKLPISDKLGMEYNGEPSNDVIGDYESFTVRNPNSVPVNFELDLFKLNLDNEIRDKYVKVYLTDSNDNTISYFNKNSVPLFCDLVYSIDKPRYKILYTGVLKSKETKKFKIRTWLSDTYSFSSNEEYFRSKIIVRIK